MKKFRLEENYNDTITLLGLFDNEVEFVVSVFTDRAIAEYIVEACNEYQALKEENEKLKEDFMKHTAQHRKQNLILQQQIDKLVEMLEKVLKEHWLHIDIATRISGLLQKIK